METRQLGRSGLTVSAIGLGGNNFGGRIDLEATRRVVHKALDAGITLIDTADLYNRGGSEECLGQILGERRKDVVLATKFGIGLDGGGHDASREYVMRAVDASLKRLRTDWIDLYQVHRPDPATPIEETLSALDDLVRQGKVRAVGCSNFSAPQLTTAQEAAARDNVTAFTSCQEQYSLLARDIEQELIPAMDARGLALLPYFPLASGLLTGKYRRDAMPEGARLTYSARHADRFVNDRNFAIVERLEPFCRAKGRTLLELAFAWLLAKPIVACVIAGASSPEQVDANVRAAGWTLSAEDLAEVDSITRAGEKHLS
jgi:aryl-alcohol dehydrogenase-like predicted oxidoreductase